MDQSAGWDICERRPLLGSAGLAEASVENNYFTEMCSGSEAGSYLRVIDFVCHSTLGLRVIKKKKKTHPECQLEGIR